MKIRDLWGFMGMFLYHTRNISSSIEKFPPVLLAHPSPVFPHNEGMLHSWLCLSLLKPLKLRTIGTMATEINGIHTPSDRGEYIYITQKTLYIHIHIYLSIYIYIGI
jgi:hypothetical protein